MTSRRVEYSRCAVAVWQDAFFMLIVTSAPVERLDSPVRMEPLSAFSIEILTMKAAESFLVPTYSALVI